MFEPIELIKLSIIVAVPLWLLVSRCTKGMLIWIGGTIGVEVLNLRAIANITPLQVVGLLCLPGALKSLSQVHSKLAGRIILWSILFLAAMGLLYGYITPWPDISYSRPWNQRAEGRSIIYMVRSLSHLSVAFYIMDKVTQDNNNISIILRYLLIGTTIAALGVLIEYQFKVDLFDILSPGIRDWDLETEGRMRGLNAEPRLSGQVCAWGILLLAGLRKIGAWRLPLLIIHIAAFIVVISTTGFLILLVGLVVLTLMTLNSFLKRMTVTRLKQMAITSMLLIFVVLFYQFLDSDLAARWKDNVGGRISRSDYYDTPANLGETISYRLEVFDASAILFFWDNPKHLIIGTGPGLISLPASSFIPVVFQKIYGDRIDSIPHTGLIQMLANTGIVGILLWFAFLLLCWQALLQKSHAEPQSDPWYEAFLFFTIFSVLYLLQERAIWFLFLGIGLSAAKKIHKKRDNSVFAY